MSLRANPDATAIAALDPLRDLEILRCGSGPPLLILHGASPYRRDLPFIDGLCESATVIAPSHPGFGASPRPEHVDSVYDLVHVYQALIDQLPFDRISLMGLSFGGWLAAEIAVNRPAKLDRLILVDAVGIKLGGREERDILHLFNTPPRELDRASWHDPSNRPRGPFGLGWQMHLDDLSDDDMVQVARSWDALCLYGWRPHLYNPRLRFWLHRVNVPACVVWGASDGVVSPSYGAAYAKLIPNARFEVIGEAGHHPELEQPRAFVDCVREFVR